MNFDTVQLIKPFDFENKRHTYQLKKNAFILTNKRLKLQRKRLSWFDGKKIEEELRE